MSAPRQPNLKTIRRELERHLAHPDWLGEAHGVSSEALDYLSCAIVWEIEWVTSDDERRALIARQNPTLRSVRRLLREIADNSGAEDERDALRAAALALDAAIALRHARMTIEHAEAAA